MPPLLFLFLSEVAAEGGLGPSLTPDEALKCYKGGCEGWERAGGGKNLRVLYRAQVGQHPGLEEGDSQAADRKAKWTSAGASKAWAAEKTLRRVTANYGFTSHPFTQGCSEPL